MKAFPRYLLLFLMVGWNTACEQRAEGPTVRAIYPSAELLPENLLRMYVQFSQPMKTVGNLEKIKLVDEEGLELKNVFFNNVHELWNHEQTQLTLILDPARVKTGLQANTTFGRALQSRKKYTLVIADLEDANHNKMEHPFEKKIEVTAADLQAPDPSNWDLVVPKANSTAVFTVKFEDMLDYYSVQQRLIITDTENQSVKGSVTIEKQETEWWFTPSNPWEKGDYLLQVNTRLEDLAGNNLNGLFDHEIGSLKYAKEGTVERVLFTIN
ncbi:MAG: Ig-like domain-containing protein [Bacteroidota bacterium]